MNSDKNPIKKKFLQKKDVKVVLVTGATSALGLEVIKNLLDAGHLVIAVSHKGDLSSVLSRNYIDRIHAALNGDLTKRKFISTLNYSFDVVVHLASLQLGESTSYKILKNNYLMTKRLVELSKRTGVESFIYASSVSVYGKIRDSEVSEQSKTKPRNPYSISKRFSEKIILRSSVKNVQILRFPAILGSNHQRNWIDNLIRKMMTDGKIEIHSPDSPFNNLVSVKDAGTFISKLVTSETILRSAFPIASTNPIKIRDLIEYIHHTLQSKSGIYIVPHNSRPFVIDDSFARNNVGYESNSVLGSLEDRLLEVLRRKK